MENAPTKSTPKRGRPRKKQIGDDITSSAVPAKGKSVELSSRRPTRGAAKTIHTELESEPTNKIRSSRARDSPEHQPETKKPKKAGRPPKAKQQVQVSGSNGYNSPAQPPEGTKVALPVADTPVIQRNKEFRGGKGDKSDKGRRRSSLSMRGRRASFLIDSGTSNGRFLGLRRAANGWMLIFFVSFLAALPHREVGTADFYKHIADDGIPEPRRMRQLLIWCATRAIGEKPSGGSNSDDQSARLAGTWNPLTCVRGCWSDLFQRVWFKRSFFRISRATRSFRTGSAAKIWILQPWLSRSRTRETYKIQTRSRNWRSIYRSKCIAESCHKCIGLTSF
jgi:Mis12-Mtw1 protein family.